MKSLFVFSDWDAAVYVDESGKHWPIPSAHLQRGWVSVCPTSNTFPSGPGFYAGEVDNPDRVALFQKQDEPVDENEAASWLGRVSWKHTNVLASSRCDHGGGDCSRSGGIETRVWFWDCCGQEVVGNER